MNGTDDTHNIGQPSVAVTCVRGCARRGTENDELPDYLGAVHGRFCDRCFYQTQAALRLAPALAGHVASLVGTKGSGEDSEIRGTKEAPLPFNAQAFDDLNLIYETLVQFAGLFAARLKTKRPDAALRAWRTPTGRVKGLPGGVSSWSANRETARMATWLDQNLERIFESAYTDEYVDIIEYFVGEVVYFRSLAARWPRTMQAKYSRLPHSDGVTCCWPRRVAIFPAAEGGESRQIRCEGCGHIWTEDEYSAEVISYEKEIADSRRPGKVVQHLLRKYVDDVDAA